MHIDVDLTLPTYIYRYVHYTQWFCGRPKSLGKYIPFMLKYLCRMYRTVCVLSLILSCRRVDVKQEVRIPVPVSSHMVLYRYLSRSSQYFVLGNGALKSVV